MDNKDVTISEADYDRLQFAKRIVFGELEDCENIRSRTSQTMYSANDIKRSLNKIIEYAAREMKNC